MTQAPPRGTTEAEHQTYQVAMSADGNCRMLSNLKLGFTTVTTELTAENTDLAPKNTFTLPQVVSAGDHYYNNPGV